VGNKSKSCKAAAGIYIQPFLLVPKMCPSEGNTQENKGKKKTIDSICCNMLIYRLMGELFRQTPCLSAVF
jgi:hypothetical protein